MASLNSDQIAFRRATSRRELLVLFCRVAADMTLSELIQDAKRYRKEGAPLGPTSEFYKFVPKTIEDNIEFRKELLTIARDEAIQQELIIICSRDLLFFVNAFGWTLSPKDYDDCPNRLFLTYPYQDRALIELQESIGKCDIAVPKSRDMGATWMCCLAMEHPWHFFAQKQFLLTSQVAEMVESKSEKALFAKLDYWWEHLPQWLMPNYKRTPSAKSAENLDLGSKMTGQATVPDLGRGDRLTALFQDEAGKMENAAEIASATRDATNCRIYNSTPNGRFGRGQYFFEVCKNPGVKKVWMHWSEHPEKNVGLYKLQRRITDPGKSNLNIGDWVTTRELDKLRNDGKIVRTSELQKRPLDPATYDWREDYDFTRLKFHVDQSPRSIWFDLQCSRDTSVKRIAQELNLDFEGSTEKFAQGVDMETLRMTMVRRPLYTGEVLPSEDSFQEGLSNLRPVWLAGAGFLELWCDLPDGKPPLSSYSIGIDVSGGTGGTFSSQSVMSVWDNISGEQVGEWRSSTLGPDELGVRAVVLAKFFHNALLIPEINGGAGTRFKNKVLACEYWNIYRRTRSEEEVFETATSKVGWYSTKGPEVLLHGLFAAFTSGEAKPRSIVLLEQCEEYEWANGKIIHKASQSSDSQADKGRAHGDAAVAAGLGWLGCETSMQLASEKRPKKADDEPEYPEGSVGWRLQQRELDSERYAGDYVEANF